MSVKPGELAGILQELKAKKTKLNAELTGLENEIEEVTASLLESMDEIGVDKLAIDGFSVTRVTEILPVIDDFDQFAAHVAATGNTSLLYRRVGALAYRELITHGEKVPGVSSFEKVKINTRNS